MLLTVTSTNVCPKKSKNSMKSKKTAQTLLLLPCAKLQNNKKTRHRNKRFGKEKETRIYKSNFWIHFIVILTHL